MGDVTDKVPPHLEPMPTEEILDRAGEVERYDRLARRNYGLDSPASGSGAVNLNVFSGESSYAGQPEERVGIRANSRRLLSVLSVACGLRHKRGNAPGP
jgi:hypothetical protein